MIETPKLGGYINIRIDDKPYYFLEDGYYSIDPTKKLTVELSWQPYLSSTTINRILEWPEAIIVEVYADGMMLDDIPLRPPSYKRLYDLDIPSLFFRRKKPDMLVRFHHPGGARVRVKGWKAYSFWIFGLSLYHSFTTVTDEVDGLLYLLRETKVEYP